MLFEMARALRSLTRSPIQSALHSARHMARPFHFEDGGVVVPHEGRVEEGNDDGDFLLPSDLDPMVVALALDAKLRDGRTAQAGVGDDPMQLLERRAGGRVVVAGHHLLRLGDGDFAKGKRFMHSLIAKIRHRR
jgi:hypothetical protein